MTSQVILFFHITKCVSETQMSLYETNSEDGFGYHCKLEGQGHKVKKIKVPIERSRQKEHTYQIWKSLDLSLHHSQDMAKVKFLHVQKDRQTDGPKTICHQSIWGHIIHQLYMCN
jgi:hypothetical protein